MPYHRIPDEEKAKSFGISLDELTVARLDALLRVGRRERSARYRELLIEGIEARFGSHWPEIADVMRERESAAGIEVLVAEPERELVTA